MDENADIDAFTFGVKLGLMFAIHTQVQAKNVRFDGNTLHILLSDGREISLPMDQMDWLKSLANTTPEHKMTIEPGGFAVYWDELDKGFEIGHLLSLQPLT